MSKLTTDKHEASRGLSATAELLVLLTRPTSLHYLVKRGCSKFLPKLDLLQSDCSDLVSKRRGYTVATTFLLRGHS